MKKINGKLVIAPPSLKGTFWTNAVIYIIEQDKEGTVGLVINKQSDLSIKTFGEYCDCELSNDDQLYVGGPTNTKVLTMLHSAEWKCDNTLKLNKDFAISSSDEILERIANNDLPEKWRLFVGLTTWPPGQLEAEIDGALDEERCQNWLTATPTYKTVFGEDAKKQWLSAINQASAEFCQQVLA
jgi:putative transcriptional regulator